MDTTKEELVRSKKVQCLQLLLLLIPEPNYKLLKDLMGLLKRVTDRQEDNRMSASNLGTLFAPLILCPRKLSAEALQSNHQGGYSVLSWDFTPSCILKVKIFGGQILARTHYTGSIVPSQLCINECRLRAVNSRITTEYQPSC